MNSERKPPIRESEQCFTVAEVARELKLGQSTIRTLFKREPGVLALSAGEGKRARIRIPQSVLDRVRRRLAAKAS